MNLVTPAPPAATNSSLTPGQSVPAPARISPDPPSPKITLASARPQTYSSPDRSLGVTTPHVAVV
jgi:hypothetical protein